MNGFDDLERQLRGKVAELAPRRRRRLLRTVALSAVALASAGAVTAAATGVVFGPGTEARADALLDSVMRDTQDVPACKPHGLDRRPATVSTLPASALALRSFPALRRPPTPHERAFARKYGRFAGMTTVLSGGARELRSVGGGRVMLLITAGRGRGLGQRPACLPVERAELERRAPHVDPDVLAAARNVLDREEQTLRENLGREGLLLVFLRPDGHYAGFGGTYTDIAVRLGTGSIGLVRPRDRRRLAISGLVPRPADHVVVRSRTHPSRQPIRRAVPEQTFSLVLPAHFGTRVSVQWRTADGRLLHVMHLSW